MKKKITNMLSTAVLLVLFAAYMFPFVMVLINSLKQKRDIIKSPFSWLFTIKGLSFDNFVKAFTQMDFPRAFGNSLIVTVTATVLVTLLASMLAYYIVRHNNKISKLTFSFMVASMIIPFQAIMIPLVSIYGGTLNVLNHRATLILCIQVFLWQCLCLCSMASLKEVFLWLWRKQPILMAVPTDRRILKLCFLS